MNTINQVQEHAEHGGAGMAALKLAPPTTVGAATTLFGVQLEHWVIYLTILYTLLMIVHKLWQMHRDFTGRSK